MRIASHSLILWIISAATSAMGQVSKPAGTAETARVSPERAPATPHTAASRLMRFEPTGLSLLGSYERGKVPAVFVHGLWANPCSWAPMIESLEADPALRERYQFWTFGYSTGDPLPYSAHLFRNDLDAARRKFDPERSDRAFDQMVIIGHSMGGLLTKMMVQDTGNRLWQIVSARPVEELAGEPDDVSLFHGALFYKPRREVRRVIFIATPHRGSRIDQGPLGRLGSRLVRVPDPLRASYNRLIAKNRPEFFSERFRNGLPTSVDELEYRSPILMRLDELGVAPGIQAHSIIAVQHDPPKADGGDGIVPYESAHLDRLTSELLVSSGHVCQDKPAVIREVRRILVEHQPQ
jgi:pimeloyl-ACP methyl ester carboxylesterase